MAMTLPTAEELFGETVRKVSSTPQEWLKFLNTASRVYQYTFDAQLMIYAQRPNAIGCTSFEKWKQMNHYVKGEHKELPLLSEMAKIESFVMYMIIVIQGWLPIFQKPI